MSGLAQIQMNTFSITATLIVILTASLGIASNAQEYSEREAHMLNAWKRMSAQYEQEANPDMKIEIEPVEFEIPSEATERKKRSEQILNSLNIRILDSLPVIETEAQSVRRSTEEIALRAIALFIVATKGQTQDSDIAIDLVQLFGATKFMTPEELNYISANDSDMHEHIQFSWRFEALNVLLWSLGYTDKLLPADEICDVDIITELLMAGSVSDLISKASLRPQSDILNEADLIYRIRWADVQARVDGEPTPGGLDSSILLERHYALNWLIGYLDQEWDDVSTDT